MDVIYAIATILALIAFIGVCVYVIMTLIAAKALLEGITSHLGDAVGIMREVKDKVGPTLESANKVTLKVHDIAERIEQGMSTVDNTLLKVDGMVGRLTDLEGRVQQKVEAPIIKAASAVSGVTKAVGAFYSSLKNGSERKDGLAIQHSDDNAH
ncbi:MAG: DUF948 domain-containing protein [Bacteroidota bacterium]